MIGTTIACTECNEPYIVVGDSIQLPYVCIKCEEEVEEFNKATAPAQTTTQTVQAEAEYIEGDPGDEHEHVHNQGDECEGATVEATTELITALEAQISDLKQSLAVEKQVAEGALEAVRQLADDNASLQAELAEDGEVMEAATELLDKFKAENGKLETEKQDLRHYVEIGRRMVGELRRRNELLRDDNKFYRTLYANRGNEVSFYRTRGFWARLFNVRYKATGQF